MLFLNKSLQYLSLMFYLSPCNAEIFKNIFNKNRDKNIFTPILMKLAFFKIPIRSFVILILSTKLQLWCLDFCNRITEERVGIGGLKKKKIVKYLHFISFLIFDFCITIVEEREGTAGIEKHLRFG